MRDPDGRVRLVDVLAARALGLPGNSVEAARASSNKLLAREGFQTAGLPCPWFRSLTLESWPTGRLPELAFPCVVKPLALAGSRGVMRADDHGSPPDGSSILVNMPDPALEGPVRDAVEMSEKFADSQYVKRCFIRQNFRYYMGRNETMADACVLSQLEYTDRAGVTEP